jgi:hypothetical protein
MRNVLALVGAATVAFLGLGWYLGWYQVSSIPSPGGKQAVTVDINPTKITDDVKRGVEKGGQIVDSLRERPTAEPKPAAGPASSFFSPTPAPANPPEEPNGWRPIGGTTQPGRDPRN